MANQSIFDAFQRLWLHVVNLLNGKANVDHNHSASDINSGTLALDRIPNITNDKISSLDASKLTGTVPTSALPSYVDDVIEGTYVSSTSFKNTSGTAITGEAGKIYVDTTTNKTYRWSGSAFVEISSSLALGTTSSTAYRGDYGNTAYTHSQKTSGNPHNVTKSDVGLSNVDNVKQYSASNPPPYPVTSVNSKTGAVNLTASDVGALPSTTTIPTKVSDLTNDSGFTNIGIVEYGVSTWSDYVAAANNQVVMCKYCAKGSTEPAYLTARWEVYGTNAVRFTGIYDNTVMHVSLNASTNEWSEITYDLLPESGGTMFGALILTEDPTENLHAVNKQYVDNSKDIFVAEFGVTTVEELQAAVDADKQLVCKYSKNGVVHYATGYPTSSETYIFIEVTYGQITRIDYKADGWSIM